MNPTLVTLALRQHGLLTRAQLRAAGVTRHGQERALQRDRLWLVHPGVFSLGPSLSHQGRDLAAVLACGRGALLSHRSAAHRWGLLRHPPITVDVTIARTTRTVLHGVQVHRSRRPVPGVTRENIPVTDVAHTLIDLADVVPYDVLHKAAMDAEHARLLRLVELRPIAGRVGNRRLARLLDHVRERTRSELEKQVLAIVRRAGLPEPQRNVVVGRFTVDLAWPEHRLIVEADSWSHHASRDAFETDHDRDLELRGLGWTVLRVTWRQLHERPELLISVLAQRVGLR